MPELPDVELYLHALRPRVVGQELRDLVIVSPFVLRTFDPPIDALVGRAVRGVERLGKRIVLAFDEEYALVVHLMIAGRLRWYDADDREPSLRGRIILAALRFESGALHLVESATRKRAAMHVVRGADTLAAHDPGGIDVRSADVGAFADRLRSGNRTLKRALTDPRSFSGIGNAYSDEILHRAGMSPTKLTGRMNDAEAARLLDACRTVLGEWTERLLQQFGDRFPGAGDITAFRPEMAVHGRYGKPCPACGSAVQRIVRVESEINYCPTCQTKGRVLADRSLSRLLKDDWPGDSDRQ